jgi:phytol kinase
MKKMNNFIGILVSYVYIALVIIGAKIFKKKGKEASRKFIHIMLGNWWFIAMYYFTNVWFAAFVPATFVIINYISYKKDLIKVMERDVQDGLGTVYYAISLLILVIVSFGVYKEPSLGLIPNLVMAYGDGLAGLLGRMIKSKRYKLSDTKKSVAGSITMFVISTLLIGGYLLYWHKEIFWSTPHWPLVAVLIGFAITAIEAISEKGTDNITVPLGTLCMLLLIG